MRVAIIRYVEVETPTIQQIEAYLLGPGKFTKTVLPNENVLYRQNWGSINMEFRHKDAPSEFVAQELFFQTAKILNISQSTLYRQIMLSEITHEDFQRIIKCEQ